jgi:hypothetical protein
VYDLFHAKPGDTIHIDVYMRPWRRVSRGRGRF